VHGIQIQLGGGEASARIQKLDLTDHALIAFTTGDAKRGTGGSGARFGHLQGDLTRLQSIERLLNFECDLLRELHALRLYLTQSELGFTFFGTTRTTIEQRPIQQQ
jgi:hypothetical protein